MIKIFSFKENLRRLRIFALLSALAAPSGAGAGLYIENYLGWTFSFTNKKPFQAEKDSSSNKYLEAYRYAQESRYYGGLSTGMRLGWSVAGLAVGGDFTVGAWRSLYKENFTSFQGKENIYPLLPGIFISYKLPLLFRAYAVFIPPLGGVLFEQNDDESERQKKWCTKSGGGKVGVSYLSLPFVSINFEYMPLHIGGGGCGSWSHSITAYFNLTF